jgi:hypothetical protein
MDYPECSSGGPHPLKDYPFCPECGALSPSYVARGSFSVKLEEVASERIRSDVVDNVKSWFPDVNPLEVDKKLKSGPSIFIRGVDEPSAQRILAYFKSIKVPGRIVREKDLASWSGRLWSPGLGVGAIALVLALLVGGLVGGLLILAGVGAVAAGAFLKTRRSKPLVSEGPALGNDDTKQLANEYALLIRQVSGEDAEALRSIATAVFDIHHRLKSDSLAAVAAGGATGDLYDRVTDMIPTALHIVRTLLSSPGEHRETLRKQLKDLNDLVKRAGQWLTTAEQATPPTPSDLSHDLEEVTQRIDRILETARRPDMLSSGPSSAQRAGTTE